MKPKIVHLCPRNAIRVMFENGDTDRLLRSGDWVLIPAHLLRPPSPEALRQRRCQARKRERLTSANSQGAQTATQITKPEPPKKPSDL